MIEVRGLRKTFRSGADPVHAVDDVSLSIEEREFFVLLGLSGSGKTTLLRSIAGLEKPETGEIRLGDRIVSSPERGIFIPPANRGVGMVFQSYAVWPHMTVFDNVAFPLLNRRGRLPRAQVRDRVRRALDLVQLPGLEDRPAPMLSGGQQQRVALARALAVEPQVLLMDEPLSNLDARLRETVRDEIKGLSQKLGVTVFYVTHDQVEAMALADTVAVMSHGKILQMGPAQSVYDKPLDRSVGEFLGSMNELKGRVAADGKVVTDMGPLACGSLPPDGDPDGDVLVGVRPTDVYVSVAPSGRENEFPGRVEARVFLGDIVAYQLSVNGNAISCKTTVSEPALEPGMNVHVRFPRDKLKVFAR